MGCGIMILYMVKKKSELSNETISKRPLLITVIIVFGVTIIGLLFVTLSNSERSVENYCKVYKEEKERLTQLTGDTWPSAVFDASTNDAGEMATSFKRLSRVAPSDIEPDVTTLQKLYQKVDDDPSQALSASLSGIDSEESVQQWSESNCKE